MSPDIITFEESFQERLILQIFWVEEVIYQCLELKNERYYSFEILKPACWQTFWKMSRQNCNDLRFGFLHL
jgi:hypothetical protein